MVTQTTDQKPMTKAERAKHSKKMQQALLRDVVHVVAGSHAVPIVEIMYLKENVNEFLIAKKLNLTINQARNILYRLSDEGMVHFTRKKDTKNGGWYTYFWTLDTVKSLRRLREKLAAHSEELRGELHKRQSMRYYYSPTADREYSEEKALEYDFICPETGEVMELKDTSDRVDEIERALEDLALKMAAIDDELTLIETKEAALRERRMKAEAKKKAEEREEKKKIAAAKRKATIARKKKEAEKAQKGTAKKKVATKKATTKKKAATRAKKVATKKKVTTTTKTTTRAPVRRKAVAKKSTRTRKAVKKAVRKKVSKPTTKKQSTVSKRGK